MEAKTKTRLSIFDTFPSIKRAELAREKGLERSSLPASHSDGLHIAISSEEPFGVRQRRDTWSRTYKKMFRQFNDFDVERDSDGTSPLAHRHPTSSVTNLDDSPSVAQSSFYSANSESPASNTSVLTKAEELPCCSLSLPVHTSSQQLTIEPKQFISKAIQVDDLTLSVDGTTPVETTDAESWKALSWKHSATRMSNFKQDDERPTVTPVKLPAALPQPSSTTIPNYSSMSSRKVRYLYSQLPTESQSSHILSKVPDEGRPLLSAPQRNAAMHGRPLPLPLPDEEEKSFRQGTTVSVDDMGRLAIEAKAAFDRRTSLEVQRRDLATLARKDDSEADTFTDVWKTWKTRSLLASEARNSSKERNIATLAEGGRTAEARSQTWLKGRNSLETTYQKPIEERISSEDTAAISGTRWSSTTTQEPILEVKRAPEDINIRGSLRNRLSEEKFSDKSADGRGQSDGAHSQMVRAAESGEERKVLASEVGRNPESRNLSGPFDPTSPSEVTNALPSEDVNETALAEESDLSRRRTSASKTSSLRRNSSNSRKASAETNLNSLERRLTSAARRDMVSVAVVPSKTPSEWGDFRSAANSVRSTSVSASSKPKKPTLDVPSDSSVGRILPKDLSRSGDRRSELDLRGGNETSSSVMSLRSKRGFQMSQRNGSERRDDVRMSNLDRRIEDDNSLSTQFSTFSNAGAKVSDELMSFIDGYFGNERPLRVNAVEENEVPLQRYWKMNAEISNGEKSANVQLEQLLSVSTCDGDEGLPAAPPISPKMSQMRKKLQSSTSQAIFTDRADNSVTLNSAKRSDHKAKADGRSLHHQYQYVTQVGGETRRDSGANGFAVGASESDLLLFVHDRIYRNLPLDWPELYVLKSAHCKLVVPLENQLRKLKRESAVIANDGSLQYGRNEPAVRRIEAELQEDYSDYQVLLENIQVVENPYTQLAYLIMQADGYWYSAKVCSDVLERQRQYSSAKRCYAELLEKSRRALRADDLSLLKILEKLSAIIAEYPNRHDAALRRDCIEAISQAERGIAGSYHADDAQHILRNIRESLHSTEAFY